MFISFSPNKSSRKISPLVNQVIKQLQKIRLPSRKKKFETKFEETNEKRRTDNDLHGRVPGNLDYLKEVSMDDTWGEWIDEWFLATIPEVKAFNEYDSSKDYEDAVRFRELIKGTIRKKS